MHKIFVSRKGKKKKKHTNEKHRGEQHIKNEGCDQNNNRDRGSKITRQTNMENERGKL